MSESGFAKKGMEELGRRSAAEVLTSPAHELLLILDDVRSMHNVGSVFRTADSFGAAGIYLCGYTPKPPHRDIHKTALGAEDTVEWRHFPGIDAALDAAVDAGYIIVAIEQAHHSTPLHAFRPDPGSRYALVFGNEVSGVSDAAMRRAAACIEIPQFGAKHSLNISVSAGVVLWELIRTQGLKA